MSSSAQICARALKRLRVVAPDEDPSAADAAHALEALNSMIASWKGRGVEVSGDVPLDARFEQGVVAMLAVRIAPDFGTAALPQIVAEAEEGWSAIAAAFKPIPTARIDTTLRNMPSQRYWVSIGSPPLWAEKTAYSVGDQVQAASHIYECTTAGTSGVLVPLGTASSIADGSVVWNFVRNA